jgi:hypothetical protein
MVTRAKTNKERRAEPARRSSRFKSPRPQLGSFTKECGGWNCTNQNPLKTLWSSGGRCRFSGASPVTSALGTRCGRDPAADTINPNTAPRGRSSKADISTLQKSGHFYFALTGSRPITCLPLLPITASETSEAGGGRCWLRPLTPAAVPPILWAARDWDGPSSTGKHGPHIRRSARGVRPRAAP